MPTTEMPTTERCNVATGINFDDAHRYNHPDNPIVATVGCPECGAAAGETCAVRSGLSSRVHQRRWVDAKCEITVRERCQDCRFVQVKIGKVGDANDDPFKGRSRKVELPKYYCQRFPPRRSLGNDYHLAQVDPSGWCGEIAPFLRCHRNDLGFGQAQPTRRICVTATLAGVFDPAGRPSPASRSCSTVITVPPNLKSSLGNTVRDLRARRCRRGERIALSFRCLGDPVSLEDA